MFTDKLDFSSANIFVFGDVMIDHYWYGDTSRISPEAPVPVVLYKDENSTLGGAANVARNLIAYNSQVSISGLVGNDDNAQHLKSLCQNINLNHNFITIPYGKTTKKLRILSRHQQLLRVDFEDQPNFNLDVNLFLDNSLINTLEDKIKQAKVVILSDYMKGSRQFFPTIIELANKYHKPIVIDPKGTDYSVYKNSTLLTPNLSEFRLIAKKYGFSEEQISDETNEVAIVNAIINDLNLQGLLITKSEKGMTLHLKDGTLYHQLTYAEDVYDVTGAGDTVIATLAAALAVNIDIKDACYLANKAAGISVSKLGAATVSIEELEQSCHMQSYNQNNIIQKIKNAQANGKRVVFTNGCFDLLHRGHLSYLQRAKELGDILVVAINTDASVKRLKGNDRPINNLADRMFMLSSLKSVDFVIDFDEDTPLNLIKTIKPDVLVKGADYKLEDIVGYKEVTAYGGQVQTITFVDSYSSTNIINRIKNN
ncbi:bifunctional D-glycero-beta-D-manno-heptose-7-phosphate kinase/D-glycero-beta-D-manno-heptose 1-phosphate adenylyltransferase HldE [Psittacicella gerlachiana]|uniref:Bifunctional protein HldE n=1 Tax=Psittacicella gerlachiana TaxID=2028574 RepID=A0A3A1YBN5_9GAMM|nr:bifunctional D-glycero-beta-D-manno-heptose-7-phosphate kinase/D-glycero-beta-D-manno-heptose 1-phosphate adenylyltransferase HldE [Psittacicella gerlachiana]RIY34598.1 hypothetical protein CKF59_05305 [Psittacicella gerlachiana]